MIVSEWMRDQLECVLKKTQKAVVSLFKKRNSEKGNFMWGQAELRSQ